MLVIYPFSTADQDQALKNARWIAELGDCQRHDIFVLSDRRCPEDLVKEVVKTLTGVFHFVQHRWTKTDIDGWPQGANHMFGYSTCLIQNAAEWPYFLWLEPDAIPVSPGWLNALEQEYRNGGKPFMGERVDLGARRPDVPVHMSGVGIYPNPIVMHAGEAVRAHDVAWDIAAKDQILPKCHFTNLIQHYWKHGTFTHAMEIRPETVLFHSSKDGSLIDVLRGGGEKAETPVASPSAPAQIRKLRGDIWVLEGDRIISEQVVTSGRLDFDTLLPHILKLVRPGDTVVDVGAFIGDHTVAYSDAVGREGQVFAFEPDLSAFKCLVHNVEKRGNVLTYNFGLGAQNSVAGMSGEFASRYVNHNNSDGGPIIPIRRLDDEITLFDRIDLMKIDIEGYELNMLQGAEQVIEKFHPKMVIEINEIALKRQDTIPRDILDWLGAHGYNDVSVLHRHADGAPFYDILALAKQPPEISSDVRTAQVTTRLPLRLRWLPLSSPPSRKKSNGTLGC